MLRSIVSPAPFDYLSVLYSACLRNMWLHELGCRFRDEVFLNVCSVLEMRTICIVSRGGGGMSETARGPAPPSGHLD